MRGGRIHLNSTTILHYSHTYICICKTRADSAMVPPPTRINGFNILLLLLLLLPHLLHPLFLAQYLFYIRLVLSIWFSSVASFGEGQKQRVRAMACLEHQKPPAQGCPEAGAHCDSSSPECDLGSSRLEAPVRRGEQDQGNGEPGQHRRLQVHQGGPRWDIPFQQEESDNLHQARHL